MIEVFGLKCLRVKTLKECMYSSAEIRRVSDLVPKVDTEQNVFKGCRSKLERQTIFFTRLSQK